MVPGHYMVLTPSFDGNVILLDPISNWNDEQKKSGKQTIDKIWDLYGGIIYAIIYEKK
jgi:ABC-type amino acid transport substrate-binding protein